MKTLKYLGESKSEIIKVLIPKPKSGEVLLKIMISAICGSERYPYMKGGMPFNNAGHELCGEIVEANNTKTIKVGDRVAICSTHGCQNCLFCHNGEPQFCKDVKHVVEGHSEYIAVAERCCLKLPDDLSWEAGVLVGGDAMGVAYRVINKLRNDFGRTVLVTGAGPIGMGVIIMLKYYGYFVIVSELNDYKREMAKNLLGADVVVNPIKEDLHSIVYELTNGYGADAVIECSGSKIAQEGVIAEVRCQGTIVFAGENGRPIEIISSALIHKEILLTGAFYYAAKDYQEINELYRRGLSPEKMITHRFSLDDAAQAFETFFAGQTGKVVICRYDIKTVK